MVRAKTASRIARLKAAIGEGCPACKAWPPVWILGEHDPEPPMVCDCCGRQFKGGVRVYISGIDVGTI
jgi:hypothetical protein